MNKIQFQAAYRELRAFHNTSAWYGFWADTHAAAVLLCGGEFGAARDAASLCLTARAVAPVTQEERLDGYRAEKIYALFS